MSSHRHHAILAAIAWFAGACGDLPDPTPPNVPGLSTKPADERLYPNTPTLHPLPQQCGYSTIPIRGRAGPGETVGVTGGAAPIAADADGNGDFCVDVPLAINTLHSLSVFAQNAFGLRSESIRRDVQQDPALAQFTQPDTSYRNVVKYRPVTADRNATDGELDALTDDNEQTEVTIPETAVWVNFGEAFVAEQLEITFPDSLGEGDDTFATSYEIWVSAHANVQPLRTDATGWTRIAEVDTTSIEGAGDGGLDVITLTAPVTFRHLSIYFIENNKIDWFAGEEIRVSQVRVLGASAVPAVPVPDAPTCKNGRPAGS